jgi:hypothetical protein
MMKKVIFAVGFLISSAVVFAQNNQQQKIDSVCRLVTAYWSERNPDKIYAMAGDVFRQQLTPENFKTACTQSLFPLGDMKTTFEAFANGINKYKAVFTTDSLSFYLSLDSKDKIETFLFKPYEK